MDKMKKLHFYISMIIVMAMTILVPSNFVQEGLGAMPRYEYGFPLSYITIYQREPTSSWLLANILGDNMGVSVDPIKLIINLLVMSFIIGVIRCYTPWALEEEKKIDKDLLKYLGILFLGLLLAKRLPHNSHSVMQYIIPPIRIQNGVLTLSGLPILALFIYSISKIFKLPRFANKSKFLIFLVIVTVVIPLMRESMDFTRSVYHTIAQSNLSAVDCNFNNSRVHLKHQEDGVVVVGVKLELMDYGRRGNDFKVRVHVPREWQDYLDVEYVELENLYTTVGHRNTIIVEEEISYQIAEGYTIEDIFNYHWHYETFYYELYNDEESIMMIDHGK